MIFFQALPAPTNSDARTGNMRMMPRSSGCASLRQPTEIDMKPFRADDRVSSLQANLATTRHELSSALIERDDEIDLVLTALLCNEHPLLVGSPGTAKSLLLD